MHDIRREYAAPIHLRNVRTGLTEVLRAAWEELAQERAGREVTLRDNETELDLSCDVDPYVLRHALRNVLDNALGVQRKRSDEE